MLSSADACELRRVGKHEVLYGGAFSGARCFCPCRRVRGNYLEPASQALGDVAACPLFACSDRYNYKNNEHDHLGVFSCLSIIAFAHSTTINHNSTHLHISETWQVAGSGPYFMVLPIEFSPVCTLQLLRLRLRSTTTAYSRESRRPYTWPATFYIFIICWWSLPQDIAS